MCLSAHGHISAAKEKRPQLRNMRMCWRFFSSFFFFTADVGLIVGLGECVSFNSDIGSADSGALLHLSPNRSMKFLIFFL